MIILAGDPFGKHQSNHSVILDNHKSDDFEPGLVPKWGRYIVQLHNR